MLGSRRIVLMNAMTLEVIDVERQEVHFPARDVAAGLISFESAN